MENETSNTAGTEALNKALVSSSQMQIFIFESISQVSGNYHSGGGLVIIAENKEKAIELIATDKDIQPDEKEWEAVETYKLADTDIKPKYFVMPDAGCC